MSRSEWLLKAREELRRFQILQGMRVLTDEEHETELERIRQRRANLPKGCVYFVKPIGMDFVKIGYTSGPASNRMMILQNAWPVKLRLVNFAYAEKEVEEFLHLAFRHLHVRGEWYRYERREFYWILNHINDEPDRHLYLCDKARKWIAEQRRKGRNSA